MGLSWTVDLMNASRSASEVVVWRKVAKNRMVTTKDFIPSNDRFTSTVGVTESLSEEW